MEYSKSINKLNKEQLIEGNLSFLSEDILKNINDIKNDLINEEIFNDSTTLENNETKVSSYQNLTNNNIKSKEKNKKNLNSSMECTIKKFNNNIEDDNIDFSFYNTLKRFEKKSKEQKLKIEKLKKQKEHYIKEYYFVPKTNNKKNDSFSITKLNFNDRQDFYQTLKNEKNKILKYDIEKRKEEQYKTTYENYQNKKVVSLKSLQNSIQRLYKDDIKKRKEKQKNLNKIFEPTFKPKINKNINRSVEYNENNYKNGINKYEEEVLNYVINKNNKNIENKIRNKILKNKKMIIEGKTNK